MDKESKSGDSMCDELVSIITPMYNAEKFIAKTIESVQAQTYQNWEMLIVDDVSTDQSAQIVQRYATEDSRIRYLRHEKNTGVTRARNMALKAAQGRYVAFLDSDDLWKTEKLEKQLTLMQRKNIAFCYCACEVIDENGDKTGQVRYIPETLNYQKLLKGNAIACLTVILDKEIVGNIKMPEIPHEDYAAWLDILKKGITAYGINEVLAEYRVNRHSLSGNKLRAAKWTWDIYRKQQKLGVMKSCYCFVCYIIAAVLKRC